VARLRLLRAESLHARPLPEPLKAHVLEQLIEARMIAAEAARLEVSASTTAVARELASLQAAYEARELDRQLAATYQTRDDLSRHVRQRLLRQALLETEAFSNIEVDEADLRRQYEGLPEEERLRPARVRAAQIVLEDEDEAVRVKRSLDRGADFATLAKTLSIAPEAAKGGDLGWFSATDMPEVFVQACMPLEPGQISEVTASPFGYHICKVLERSPQTTLDFEQMKDDLRERRLADLRREAEAAYLSRLKGRYDVVRHPERMKLED